MGLFCVRWASAEWEGISYGVNDYNPCEADNLSNPHLDAKKFNEGLDDIGYQQTTRYVDDSVDAADFADNLNDQVDPSGLDHADVGFFSGHGSRLCDETADDFSSRIFMGDDGGSCSAYTDSSWAGSQYRMVLGNEGAGELQFLYLFACQTAHQCVWENGGYHQMGQYSSVQPDPFRVIFGFHGISFDASNNDGKLKDYVHDAESNNLGSAWIDEFYIKNFWLTGKSQCPTVIVWADTFADAETQFNAGGLKDMKPVNGAPETSVFWGIDGCDPQGGDPLDLD